MAYRENRNAVPYHAMSDIEDSPKVRGLVSRENVIYLPGQRDRMAKWNWVKRMSQTEIDNAVNLIDRRYQAADPVTVAIAEKMERLEKLYRGEFIDQSHIDEEHIFLAKGREALQVVSAFLYGMLLQIPKLLEFRPAPTSLIGLNEKWRSAKLSEALTNYYFDDLWKVRHTVLRDFIKTFLKFPSAFIRTDYEASRSQPDLRFTVVDRALQRIDVNAHRIKDAKWWVETEFWERAAVEEMFKMGYWVRPPDLPDMVPSIMQSAVNDATLRRFFGPNTGTGLNIEADEQVEVRCYRQPPRRGLDDRYAVTLGGTGGWLVAYGNSPSPYKGLPYSGDSFDRHEWQIDGHGLLEMHESLNEIINTLLNMRLDDVRQNNWSPAMVPSELVDSDTLDDIEARSKLVRGNKEVIDSIIQGGKKLADFVVPLPINSKSTEALYQDIAFALGQSDRSGHAGDVFRGQSPTKVTTAQEIQEVLSNNQGVFQPAFMSIMQTVEDMGEISNAYFRSPDFYGEERIMLATGGRYQDVVKQWDFDQDGLRAASVTFDQMNNDVTIRATNGAEAMLARTFKAAVVKELIASIGQVEGLFPELQDRFDMVPVIIDMFRGVVSDIDQFERSPEQVAERQKQRMEKAQQALAQQTQMEALSNRAKAEAKADGDIKAAQGKAAAQASADAVRITQETDARMREIAAQANADSMGEIKTLLVKMAGELDKIRLDHAESRKDMVVEQALEVAAQKAGADSSVGPHGGGVDTSKKQ